jgi:hypothetical protein
VLMESIEPISDLIPARAGAFFTLRHTR